MQIARPKAYRYVAWLLLTVAIFLVTVYYLGNDPDFFAGIPALTATNVTVVTAFVNIGDYQKGSSRRTVQNYLDWMKIWQKVKNGVVFFTDDTKYGSMFTQYRAINKLPTEVVLIDIDNNDTSLQDPLWSVNLLPNITQIFQRPGYPKHHPNTVYAKYSAIMNLKFDALEKTTISNPFSTSNFAWIDIGMYRDDRLDVPCFRVGPPPDYKQTRIAVNRVDQFIRNLSIENIISNNRIWIGGTLLFGHKDAMLKFIKQYRATAEAMIRRGWYSTDQQTIYGMYADPSLNVPLDVECGASTL